MKGCQERTKNFDKTNRIRNLTLGQDVLVRNGIGLWENMVLPLDYLKKSLLKNFKTTTRTFCSSQELPSEQHPKVSKQRQVLESKTLLISISSNIMQNP